MIDWLTIQRVPLDWHRAINGGQMISINEIGEVEYQVQKRKPLEGSYASNLMVRSVECGYIELSGNPAKWLQGHNLFGTNDLPKLLAATMERICSILAIEPTPANRAAWALGDIPITRLDVTAMYDLPTRRDVTDWLVSASETASAKYGAKSRYVSGTLYFGAVNDGQRARDWMIKIYGKGVELEVPKHQLHEKLPMRDLLLHWADTKLRMEVTLRRAELKRLWRPNVSDWTPRAVEATIQQYMGKIDMGTSMTTGITCGDDGTGPYDGLKAAERGLLALWETGANIHTIYPRTTLYRLRKKIKAAAGIDVFSTLVKSNVVPMIRILEARPVNFPFWASEDDCCRPLVGREVAQPTPPDLDRAADRALVDLAVARAAMRLAS